MPYLLFDRSNPLELPPGGTTVFGNRETVTQALKEWLKPFPDVQIWADVPAYDWVLFCQLFGGALHVPSQIHYIVRDLATLLECKGIAPDTDRFVLAYGDKEVPAALPRHNALADVWAGMRCLERLLED